MLRWPCAQQAVGAERGGRGIPASGAAEGAGSPADQGSRRLRLLVTTTTLPRFENDPEPRFVLDLTRGLAQWFDVLILAPSFPGAAPRERLERIDVVRYRYAPVRRLEMLAYPGGIMPRLRAQPLLWALVPALLVGQAWALHRLLRRERFDFVHCHWIVPQGLLMALQPRRLRPPFMVTSHGGDLHGVVGRSFAWLVRFTLARAATATAVSLEIQNRMSRIAGPALEARVIPMGVDFGRFDAAAAGNQRVAELRDAGPVILFVGRLAEKKGVVHLLQAVARDEPGLAAATLAVIGDGPLRAALEAEAARLRLAGRVRFLGGIGHDRLPSYLASADIFCQPSVVASDGDTDGLPVTLLEAAASGLPIVTTRVGGVPDFITDDVNGLLVPPADPAALASALSRLLGDPALRARLGAAARQRVQELSWDSIARRYADAINAALTAEIRCASA